MAIIDQSIKEHIEITNTVFGISVQIEKLAKKVISTFKKGNKILIMGNGGSAADSQHFSTELVVRFRKNRKALPAIALTTDTSVLTAAGNDFSFDMIFARQIEALACKNDLVLGISTSGKSANIIKGLETAKKIKCATACLLGNRGGDAAQLADFPVIIDSDNSARIQECHILIIHIICEIIDKEFGK